MINQIPMKKISEFIFSLNDIIGEGFSSSVYKGKHIEKEFPVAIKAIQLKKIANDVQKELLNNEVKALRTLNHPNTIKLFELFQTSNNIYIITELYDQDLATLLKNAGPLSEKKAMTILNYLIQAFIQLAEKSIVHRDIKPSNILLKKEIPVVADFGFCEFTDVKKQNKQFYNVGSPKYMSPQAYKKTLYSHKSDLWGLGMVYLQMLCGKLPFEGMDYDEMIKSIASGRPYSDLKISGFSKMLLSRMLSVDIDRRPSFIEILNLIKSAPTLEQQILKTRSGAVQNIIPQAARGRTSFYQQNHPNDSLSQPKHRQSFRQNSIPQLTPLIKQASQIKPIIEFKNKENQYFPVDLKHHWSEKVGLQAKIKEKMECQKISSTEQLSSLKIQNLLKIITVLHSDTQVQKNQDNIKLLKLLHQLAHLTIKKQEQKTNGKTVELANLQIILLGYGYLTFQDVGEDKYYHYIMKNMEMIPYKQLYPYIDFWVSNCIKYYETKFKKLWNFEQISSNQEAFSQFTIVNRLLNFSKKLKGQQSKEFSPTQSESVTLELFSEVFNEAESVCI